MGTIRSRMVPNQESSATVWNRYRGLSFLEQPTVRREYEYTALA